MEAFGQAVPTLVWLILAPALAQSLSSLLLRYALLTDPSHYLIRQGAAQ